jgi:hypothetical protein
LLQPEEVLSEGTTVLYPQPEQLTQTLQQPLLSDKWYKKRVEVIRKMYPYLTRHKKTKTRSWREVYNEYLADMSRIPELKADVIKEQNFERSDLVAAKRGSLEEEE